MTENHDKLIDQAGDAKLPYKRPELARHGKVEQLTRQPAPNTSRPPIQTEG